MSNQVWKYDQGYLGKGLITYAGPQGPQGGGGSQGIQGPQGPQGTQGPPPTQGSAMSTYLTGNQNFGSTSVAQAIGWTSAPLPPFGNTGSAFSLSASGISIQVTGWYHIDLNVEMALISGSGSGLIFVDLYDSVGTTALASAAVEYTLASTNVQGQATINGNWFLVSGAHIEALITQQLGSTFTVYQLSSGGEEGYATTLSAHSLNNSGPVGAQGAGGAQGAAGAQGPVGPQGAAGTQGAVGPQGAAGPQGAMGPQGAAGSQGSAGTQGSQGAAGPQGAAGGAGAQGAQGAQGHQGAQGPQGSQGPQGVATAWSVQAEAAAYVSPAGSSHNSGGPQDPWPTLAYAQSQIAGFGDLGVNKNYSIFMAPNLNEALVINPWITYQGWNGDPLNQIYFSVTALSIGASFTTDTNNPSAELNSLWIQGPSQLWFPQDSSLSSYPTLTVYGCYLPSLTSCGVTGTTGATGTQFNGYFYDTTITSRCTFYGENWFWSGALGNLYNMVVSTDKYQAVHSFQSWGYLGSLSTQGVSGTTCYVSMEATNWQAGSGSGNQFGATVTTSLSMVGAWIPYGYGGTPLVTQLEMGYLGYRVGATANWGPTVPTSIQQGLDLIVAKLGPL